MSIMDSTTCPKSVDILQRMTNPSPPGVMMSHPGRGRPITEATSGLTSTFANTMYVGAQRV